MDKVAYHKTQVHFLPCKIMYNGKADVKSFFASSLMPSATDPGVLENGFRGRPLNGINIQFGEDRTGLILNDSDDKKHSIEGKFDSVYSWQLDEPKLSLITEPFNKTMTDWFSASYIVSF